MKEEILYAKGSFGESRGQIAADGSAGCRH